MRLIILGATGSLGRHVLRQALAAGHEVSVLVRDAARLAPEVRGRVAIYVADLDVSLPVNVVEGHDALVNCAGNVADGARFVALVARIVEGVESLPLAGRPVCWLLAGAALLDIDESGRRGVEMPRLKTTYWPHDANFQRLVRSGLDWRLLCPGPMVEQPALGFERLRISLDRLPVPPLFASLIPRITVPYADAAALMLANLDRGNAMARHRVGLAKTSQETP